MIQWGVAEVTFLLICEHIYIFANLVKLVFVLKEKIEQINTNEKVHCLLHYPKENNKSKMFTGGLVTFPYFFQHNCLMQYFGYKSV